MKIIFTLILLLTTILSTSGQIIYKDSIAPKIEFTNWINNPDGVSVINNKPVVLEFWSTWCVPCVNAIPHFNDLTEKYKQDITFISINSYETKEIVEKFLTKKPMASFVALDEDKSLKNAFNVESIPVTIIIDKDGMLRWRGITSELTNDLLDTFITQNIFQNIYKQGVIVEQVFSVNSLENVDYQLLIEYGDATLGKGISTNSEGEFFLKLSNYSIYSVLYMFSDWFDMENKWKFEGNLPNNIVINLTIKCDVELSDKEDTKELINDVTLKLSEYFNFTILENEELQTVWYIIPDTLKLKQYLSANQDLEIKVIEQTSEHTKYQNIFFNYLASSLSIKTKEKVEFETSTTSYYYDLVIPKSNNILEMKKFLKEEYGINLVEKNENAQVKIAIFN
jgi:thiol-disulfide isomerase/thioredoxin